MRGCGRSCGLAIQDTVSLCQNLADSYGAFRRARQSTVDHAFEHRDQRVRLGRILDLGKTLFPTAGLRTVDRQTAFGTLGDDVAGPDQNGSVVSSQVD